MSYPILKPNSTWFSPNVTTIKRSTITTINIVDSYTPADTPVDSWDASVAQDGSIMCYVEGTILTIVGNGSGGIFANEDSSFAFSDFNTKNYFTKVSTINGLNLLDTGNVTTMYAMFYSCEVLTKLELSNWNVSNVTNMSNIFGRNFGLESLNMTGWNTSNLINMNAMFYMCVSLKEIDVSNFDTHNVTDMGAIFSNCYDLEIIKGLENWDTSNVTTMHMMFRTTAGYGPPNTNDIRVLDLSSFNTSNVVNMGRMFENCPFLETIYFGEGWDTSNVEDMSYMFNQCSALIELDLSKWDTTSTTNMTSMFRKCNNLEKVTLGDKFSFKGNGGAYCTLPNPSSDYIDDADGYWYALDGTAFTPDRVPSLKAATYYASVPLSEAARIDIHFNDERYIIEKALLASTIEDLDIHFSTVINGDGAVINFMGAEYNIDAEKLSTATDALVLNIETLAGSGKKVNVGGIDYGIDSTKVARTFEDLENLFKDLESSRKTASGEDNP